MFINRSTGCLLFLLFFSGTIAPVNAQQFTPSALKAIAQKKIKKQKAKTDYLPLIYEQTGLETAKSVGNDQIWSGGEAGLALSGSGVTIGLWDGGNDYRPQLTHPEYDGRITFQESASKVDNHATKIAGTMIASGSDPAAKGMAFEASIDAFNFDDDDREMAQAAQSGLTLSAHPYTAPAGWNKDYAGKQGWVWYSYPGRNKDKAYQFGYYDAQARTWDDIVYNAPNYLIVKSAGSSRGVAPPSQPVEHWVPIETDSGYRWEKSTDSRPANGRANGYETLTSSEVSKNLVVVGAVKSTSQNLDDRSSIEPRERSGFGPTDDGRIKPDLVAPGRGIYTTAKDSKYGTIGHTSGATAVVTGSAALLREHYRNIMGSSARMLASSLKSLLIHTADDIGPTGPDYKFGWGLLNTERSARFLSTWDAGVALLQEFTLQDGQSKQFSYQSRGNQPLKVTIGWTDPKGSVPDQLDDPTQKILINDLDVRVTGPDGNSFNPWTLDPDQPGTAASNGDNTRDNVEQLIVENPTAGEYTVSISHKRSLDGGSQKVSLLVGPAEPRVPVQTIAAGNWSQSSSWESGQVPVTSFEEAVIKHDITLDQDATVGGITFEGSGARMELGSNRLTLYGGFQNGTAPGLGGTDQAELILKNSSSYSDPLQFAAGENDLKSLIVDLPSSRSIYLGSVVNIHELLSLKGGVLNTQNHPVTMMSDQNNAAVLDVESGHLEGALSYSRLYHHEGSGWRLLSVPFDEVTFSGLADPFHTQGGSWAEDEIGEPQNPDDPVSNLWLFNEDTQSYAGYYGSDQAFTPGDGYLFYMYKDESDGSSILPARWKISGNQPENVSISLHRGDTDSESYNLVGNPFAGVLDWEAVQQVNPDLGAWYAVWDPAETSGGGTAGFKYYNKQDEIGAAGQYIAPMQGFFVTAIQQDAKLDFAKNQKVTGNDPEIFGKERGSASQISSHIQLQLQDESGKVLDSEIYMVFSGDALQGNDPSDVRRLRSLSGRRATLSFVGSDGKMLAFEGRPMDETEQLFDLKPEISQMGTYRIKWPVWHEIPEDWQLILKDGETGAEINMRSQSEYQFEYEGQDQAKGEKQKAPPTKLTKGQEEKARFRIKVTRRNQDNKSTVPSDFAIQQNYPNPFNPQTTIPYELPERSEVTITVFNLLGQQIQTLVDTEQEAGHYEVTFNGTELASGLYFYRIKAGSFVETRGMTLIK